MMSCGTSIVACRQASEWQSPCLYHLDDSLTANNTLNRHQEGEETMRKQFLLYAVFVFFCSILADAAARQEGFGTKSQSPFYFIPNKGQVDSKVLFYHSGNNGKAFFTRDGITITVEKPDTLVNDDPTKLSFKSSKRIPLKLESFRLIPLNMLNTGSVYAEELLPGKVNYLFKEKKTLNIPTYKKVRYGQVQENVDLVFYGNEGDLEYDIVINPGGDPSKVRFALEGIQGLRIDQNGNLLIHLKEGILTQEKPRLYQEKEGKLSEVTGAFKILAKNGRYEFGFDIGKYDKNRSLIIDPIINYATYFGGGSDETNGASTLDSSGNIYLTGNTLSTDYPTLIPLQGALAGGTDAFITKLSPDGSTLIWSTYLGGSGDEFQTRLSVDASEDLWLSGATNSIDFPTQGAYQSSNGGGIDVYIARISSDGTTLEYSTYLGGSGDEQQTSPLFDTLGNFTMVGFTLSPNFPTTPGSYDITCGTDGTCNFDVVAGFGWEDLFVTKFSSDGTSLIYSTFIGGSGGDFTFDAAVDGTGSTFIHGGTSLNTFGIADFPIVNAYQPTFGGGFFETFLLNLDASGSSLLFSTYFGGSGNDFPSDIDLTSTGIVICGRTFSTDFPVQSPLQGSSAGGEDGFLSKFSLNGTSLLYSTYLGGTGSERIRQVLVDGNDDFWVAGITNSSDFPLQNAIQSNFGGVIDAYISKISADGSSLLFSSYIGGSQEDQGFNLNSDSSGGIYLSGFTSSHDFPTANAIQLDNAGGFDAFVVRLVDSFTETFSDGNADSWLFKNGVWTVIPASIESAAGGFALSGTVHKKGEAIAPEFVLGVGSLEADIQIQTARAKAFLRGWRLDKRNFVELKILEQRDKIMLVQRAKGGGLVRRTFQTTIDINTTYHFKIKFDGQNFQVFMNNDPTAVITMPAIGEAMGGLAFRLRTGGGGSATASITNIVAN
jgi:hypothetical protein